MCFHQRLADALETLLHERQDTTYNGAVNWKHLKQAQGSEHAPMIEIRLAAIICALALAACRGEATSIYLGSANDAPELPSTISDDITPSPEGAVIRFVDV